MQSLCVEICQSLLEKLCELMQEIDREAKACPSDLLGRIDNTWKLGTLNPELLAHARIVQAHMEPALSFLGRQTALLDRLATLRAPLRDTYVKGQQQYGQFMALLLEAQQATAYVQVC